MRPAATPHQARKSEQPAAATADPPSLPACRRPAPPPTRPESRCSATEGILGATRGFPVPGAPAGDSDDAFPACGFGSGSSMEYHLSSSTYGQLDRILWHAYEQEQYTIFAAMNDRGVKSMHTLPRLLRSYADRAQFRTVSVPPWQQNEGLHSRTVHFLGFVAERLVMSRAASKGPWIHPALRRWSPGRSRLL